MKIYTIRDVAAQAGVSVTTVSRVLNHRPDVNPDTRKRVEQVMAEMHFVGNASARELKQQDAGVAALILRGRANPFLSGLAERMLQFASGEPVSFLLETIDEQADEFQTAVRLAHEKRARGFIFVGSHLDARVAALRGLDVPLVFTTVSAAQAGLARASSVAIDDRRMGEAAMQTLIDAGHRRIAIFGSRTGSSRLAQRYAGAMDACAGAGIAPQETQYVETRFSLEAGYAAAQTFFGAHGDTTAVFAMSDLVAMGVIRALRDMGKDVPQDVSVFGFDGIEMGRYFIPRLATVAQPHEALARTSVDVLLDMLLRGGLSRHLLLDAEIVRGESVAPRKTVEL